jgi:hypothetical protein
MVFTFFLGFIDEGYYDFTTFTITANYVILGVYFTLFCLTQHMVYLVLTHFKPMQTRKVIAASVVVGLLFPITVVLIIAAYLSL